MPDDLPSPWRSVSRRGRWGRRLVTLRRAVLRRRRLIAAVLTAVAVLAALRTVSPPAERTVPVLVATRDLPSGAVVSGDDKVYLDGEPGGGDGPQGIAPPQAGPSPVMVAQLSPAGVQRLEPKVMDLLCLLASEPGRVWAREELMTVLWPGLAGC